jgi:O-antigen/teichoic acid export membrane protein
MSFRLRIPTGAFARQVAMLTTGTAVGQLILVAVMPLVTRLFTPSDMGVFGLFSSFLGVASVATCLRLEWGVASARTPDEAAGLLVLCLVVCPVASLVLAAGLAGLIHADLVSFALLPMWTVPLAFLALMATGAFGALRYWHVGRRDFRDVSGAAVAQGVGRAGALVAFGLAGTGWPGLLLGDLVGRLLGIGRLWRNALPGLQGQLTGNVRRMLAQRLRAAWRYPFVVLPSSLLDALAAALPLPVIATLFGPASAGQFALVWRVASVPAALIGASVADVFHAHAASARVKGGREVRRLLLRTVFRLALLAAAIYVPVCAAAPLVFEWLFGRAWHASGWLMLLLLPMWWISAVVSPVSRLLVVMDRPALKLIFDVSFLALPIAAMYLLRARGMNVAVFAYGIAASAAYVLYGALLWIAASSGSGERHDGPPVMSDPR